MSAAVLMSSRSRSCSFTERSRSACDVGTFGSLRISIGCVDDRPSTVSFTVYFPGTTIGPTCACSSPQCVTGRVSCPRKRGSSQICGFSGGVVRIAMSRGGSCRRSHDTRFRPSRGVARRSRTTVPCASST